MNRLSLLGSSALRSVAFMGFALAASSPAFAQDAPAEEDPPATLQSEVEIESGQNVDAEAGGETITVTGSRIRRPNLESAVPVTSIGGEEFFQTGQVSVGDVLNELPALRSTFSQANSTRFLGTGGLNLLDLRGLGTQRTLVLQNGRRHVGSNVLGNAVEVDVNTIPTDLIERVDVVTGGNSAIYGSDAIAGVVNFVLKRDFEGIQLRGQGGVSKYGDAGSYYASLLAGQNFADDRGNIAVNLEYARQNPFYGSGRPNLRNNQNFVVIDTDPAGSPNGSDGFPDRIFINDIRFASLHPLGSVLFGNANGDCGMDPAGNPYACSFIFSPDGQTLSPQTGTRIGLAPTGNFVGGNGFNNRENKIFGVFPEVDRYSANLLAHFTVSEAFEPFIEAKYVRTDAQGLTNASAAFSQGGTIEGFRERPRLDNPFLSAQARSVIEQQIILGGGTPTDATRFSLRRNLNDLGTRLEESKRETYRVVAGVRGSFNDDWSYEVSANYGRLDEETLVGGNLNLQRFVLATDAAIDPATGTIRCRSQFDPTAAFSYLFPADQAFADARLAEDIAACLPYNQFGDNNSQAVRDYLISDTVSVGRVEQFVLNGFVSGDSSDWFELPGGPIGFAIGAEYRKDDVAYLQDELVQAGLTFYNAIPTFDPPSGEVKEAFGEIRLPIISDTPFFEELVVSGAVRVADYKGPTGTVYAYNGGVEWAPFRDLRLRGNYSRAVRAPNLADRFTPQGQNFAPGFGDPCSARNIGTGSSTRAANCAAAGRPDGYDFVYSSSLSFVSGGNPDLMEETSDSYTIGGVFQPSAVPGLSLTVDYYDITVDDVITSPSAQQIADACYDASDLNNQFCDLFQRAGPGGGPQGEVPFQIIEGSLQATLLNYAALKVRGIDVEAAYRRQIDGLGRIDTRFTYTHVLQNDSFLDPTDPDRADQILFELGDPRDAYNWNINLETGPVTLGYQMRYIGKQVLNQYEDFFSKQGRDPQNADYADRKFYQSVLYHDIRVGLEAGDGYEFYVGVDNVSNRLPPLGLTGVGGGSGIYDIKGRFFYAGAVAKF